MTKYNYITKREEQQIRKIISAALNKYNADDLLQYLYDECRNNDEVNCLEDKILELAPNTGAVVVKCENFMQEQKLQEFINSEVFPYYNIQQTQIFSS